MTAPTEVVPISEAEAAQPDAKHHVLVEFKDDHSIDGAKFDVINVSAEQCMVVAAYLSRIANQMLDATQLQAAMQSREVQAMQRHLDGGGKPSLATLRRGRRD